ncbi:MAG TPA: histidinol-phosphate transaminase [Acidobacteriota bacterium]|nr:histidinol-phosphate transaminase [Acidobacteriota bacterium]
MSKNSPLYGVKEQVLEVPAYTLRTYEAEIKLNQNENPYDFPVDLKEETFRRYRERQWSRYPDFVPDVLRGRLADFAGWQRDGVLVGNGSNELLQATLLVLVKDRTPVVLPSPTFTVYGLISRVLGARVISVSLNPDMSYDVDGLIEELEEADARLLIVCTPNNPTGTLLEEHALKRILDRFAGHVLLDEAYYEFCGKTGLKYLASYPRLIITRTFSKAMGMAGLRVGYLMAHPDLTAQISKAKLPYNVNQFSLTAAEVALDNAGRFRPAIDAILAERDRLGAELRSIPGIRVFPTAANFFLFEVPAPPRLVFDDLCREGILIRDVSAYPMLSKCLRVTVGTRKENDRFLTALSDSIKKVASTGTVSA